MSNIPSHSELGVKTPAPTVPARPVNPFAVNCRFDRIRGEFVVHAGARAGATAVFAFVILAIGSVAFVRMCFRSTSPVSAAVVAAPSVLAPQVSTTPDEVVSATPEPSSDSEYTRTVGLNYVIVKSVPSKRAALAARESLNRRGIATTVEKNLPGWSGKGWYSVVGMTGFDLDREQDLFDRYVKDLKSMKLDPKPYKWRGKEVAAAR